MSEATEITEPPVGPMAASDLAVGAEFELHAGYPVRCMPTGGDGARASIAGAQALATDPEVLEAGLDAAYTPDDSAVYAPDLAVGNVPDKRGRIPGVPRLAVEYSSTGQDEEKLQDKIVNLLNLGTERVWVVRLLGPRRVEVYEKGAPVRTYSSGDELLAPGILRFPVRADALFDSDVARETALRNLLARHGYESVDAVREEGREEGREEVTSTVGEKLRGSLAALLRARGLLLADQALPEPLAELKAVDSLIRLLTLASSIESLAELIEQSKNDTTAAPGKY